MSQKGFLFQSRQKHNDPQSYLNHRSERPSKLNKHTVYNTFLNVTYKFMLFNYHARHCADIKKCKHQGMHNIIDMIPEICRSTFKKLVIDINNVIYNLR